jgi:hypothetical protein
MFSIISLFLNIKQMEGYTVANGTPGNSAPVGGRRSRHPKSAKKVSARTIRATLRKLHMRPKSRVVLKGGEEAASPDASPSGGRRRRSTRRRGRRGPRSLRGMLGF